MNPAVFSPARWSRSRCRKASRRIAWMPVRNTLPRSRVYLSSRETLARVAGSTGAFIGQLLRARLAYPSDRSVAGGSPIGPGAARRVLRLVPIRLGAERFRQVIDENARLRGQVAPVRIDGVDGDIRAEVVARQDRHEQSAFELQAHIPGGFEGDSQARKRPFAQHFPVVARILAGDAHRAALAVGALVFPGHLQVVRGEAVVALQVRRRLGRAAPGQVPGARAHDATIGGELARRERGVLELADADREV